METKKFWYGFVEDFAGYVSLVVCDTHGALPDGVYDVKTVVSSTKESAASFIADDILHVWIKFDLDSTTDECLWCEMEEREIIPMIDNVLKPYSGYTNWPTWYVSLVIDNNESVLAHWQQYAANAMDDVLDDNMFQ